MQFCVALFLPFSGDFFKISAEVSSPQRCYKHYTHYYADMPHVNFPSEYDKSITQYYKFGLSAKSYYKTLQISEAITYSFLFLKRDKI